MWFINDNKEVNWILKEIEKTNILRDVNMRYRLNYKVVKSVRVKVWN